MDAEPALALARRDQAVRRARGRATTSASRCPPGARMALIGPNGAGKTTLFNLVSGVYGVDRGSIMLARAGRSMTCRRASASAPGWRDVPEHPADAAPLGDREHHAGPAHAATGSARCSRPLAWQRNGASRRQAEDGMRRAGIDVDPDAAVSGLPYGVRKRIEVVRALMSRPRVLMLDEPAAGLNPRETAELSAFLKSVARGRPDPAGGRARHVVRARPVRPHRRAQLRPPDL